MIPQSKITHEEWVISIKENKKIIACCSLMFVTSIITIVGIMLATTTPELYLENAWGSASNLLKFKIVLGRSCLATGLLTAGFMGMGAPYSIYLSARYIYFSKDPINENNAV